MVSEGGPRRTNNQWDRAWSASSRSEESLGYTVPLHVWAGAVVVSHSGISALPSSLSTQVIHPSSMLTGKGRLVLFFFLSTFCLSIDRADGNLVTQLPGVPIWSEYIWKEIIWMHLLFKNGSENRHGIGWEWEGERLFIFFFLLPAPSISFPKTNKKINSYNIKSQQALLLLPSTISK